VQWSPTYQPDVHQGFVVFRAAAGGSYRQVSGIVTGNDFTDETARRGVDYFYEVQTIDARGTLSQPSAPVLHRY
jgi:fibronectin type 3 domain-containing protein